jgi:hypothetical protein
MTTSLLADACRVGRAEGIWDRHRCGCGAGLTGRRRHYFDAPFITEQEQKARSNPPALSAGSSVHLTC